MSLLQLTLLLLQRSCNAAPVRPVDNEVVCLYEEWTPPIERIESMENLHQLLPLRNSGEKSENNYLLHLYTSECSAGMDHPFFGGAHYQTGPAVLHLAAIEYDKVHPHIFDDWNLDKNCSLFMFIPFGRNYEDFADFKVMTDDTLPGFTSFIHENRRSQVKFRNDYGKDIKFYWYEKNPKFLDKMRPNLVRTEHTFLGHIFKATDAEDDSFIDLYVVDGTPQKSISRDAMNAWCENSGFAVNSKQCIEEYEAEMIDWAYKFWTRKRESLNFAQPHIVPNFTRIGFKITKLPDDVYNPILEFWQKRKAEDSFTTENYAGPVLNQFTSPTVMAHLPGKERQILIDYFRVALAEWAGVDEDGLEMTSLYGIRKYQRDAVLHLHVDTCSTHVISAIVNVDSKLDEGKDWPLQIYDHQGILHEFGMKPQDVVFYESAKCGHARRKPLPGDYYANLFIHYKPSGHWDFDWF